MMRVVVDVMSSVVVAQQDVLNPSVMSVDPRGSMSTPRRVCSHYGEYSNVSPRASMSNSRRVSVSSPGGIVDSRGSISTPRSQCQAQGEYVKPKASVNSSSTHQVELTRWKGELVSSRVMSRTSPPKVERHPAGRRFRVLGVLESNEACVEGGDLGSCVPSGGVSCGQARGSCEGVTRCSEEGGMWGWGWGVSSQMMAVFLRLLNLPGRKPDLLSCVVTSVVFNVMTGANILAVHLGRGRNSKRCFGGDHVGHFFVLFFVLRSFFFLFSLFNFFFSFIFCVYSRPFRRPVQSGTVGGERATRGLECVVLPEVVVGVVSVLSDQVVVPLASPLDGNSFLVVADH